MFKNKTTKLFLIFGVILFSLGGVVGCTSNENETTKEQESIETNNSNISESTEVNDSNISESIEGKNSSDDGDEITGPTQIRHLFFSDFSTFKNYFKDLNMSGPSFVSFNLDDSSSVGEIYYFYTTNQPRNDLIIDLENYSYALRYEFYSIPNLIGSGIHHTSFKIECYHILLINDCSEYNFDFKLVNEKESILIYDLMLNDECVMKIKIHMEENYTSKNLEDVVLMLKNNIMIIRGGE